MRQEGLRVKGRRRFRPTTTDSPHPHPVAANVLARRFAVIAIGEVNRVWAGDITYIPTREGWLLLGRHPGLGEPPSNWLVDARDT